MKIKALLVLASVLAMAGTSCSGNSPPDDAVSPPADAAAASASPAETPPVEPAAPSDVSLTVEPGVVHACEGRDRVTSVIRWDVTRPGVNAVKVLVSDPSDPEKKTLAMMAPKGEATTGEWVTQGVLIELVDAETGAPLASHTVTALPCD